MTKPGLQMLNGLSYILECGLLGYNGELKTELTNLCNAVSAATTQDTPSPEVCSMLQTAQDYYRRDDYRSGASALSKASRAWWREALA